MTSVSNEAAEKFLAAPWLAELDSTSRIAVLNVLREGEAGPGVLLQTQGQPNDHITFLVEGSAVIVRAYPGRKEESVATLNAPTVFGESAFFRRTPALVSVRTSTPVKLLTLDRHAHELLRRADPRAAEQLALAAVRVLAERFDEIDRRVSDYLSQKPEDHPRVNEWATFRARLFGESNI